MENIACFDSGKEYHEMSSYTGILIQAQTGQCERALSYLIKLSRKLLNFILRKRFSMTISLCLQLSFGSKHSKLLQAHHDTNAGVFLFVTSHLINKSLCGG